MNKRSLIVLSFLFSLSACKTIQISSESNYESDLAKYVGQPIEIVVNSLGQADGLSESPNGNKLFVYSNSEVSTSPEDCRINSFGREVCVGGNTTNHHCKTFFEVDENNVVLSYSFKGNNCRSCSSQDALLCF